MIPEELIMIFGRPAREDGESENRFIRSKMISGKPKIVSGKQKNCIHLFKNQFPGKNLQGAGKNLKGQAINLKILGDGSIFLETFRKFGIPVGDFNSLQI